MTSKKNYNNLNLLGDIKSSIVDKAFFSRQPSSILNKKLQTPPTTNFPHEKGVSLGKTLKNTINDKLNFYKTNLDKKKPDLREASKEDRNQIENPNKIDIKISVNYANNNTTNTTSTTTPTNLKNQNQSVTPNKQSSQGKIVSNNHSSSNSHNTSQNYIGGQSNHATATKLLQKENTYLDRENIIKFSYKDNEKYIRKKIITNEGKDYDKGVKNQSHDSGCIQKTLIFLFTRMRIKLNTRITTIM